MAQFEIVIEGTEQLNEALQELGTVGFAAAQAALVEEAEAVMTQAKLLCPVDTGALRASGQVRSLEEVQAKAAEGEDVAQIAVELGFGNAAVTYAIYVHENLTAHHTVGQAKFLEQPLQEAVVGMAGRIAAAVIDQLEAKK